MATSNKEEELFSSLVSNIKSYSGTDPLRPWIQGIRKMKESLPPRVLKEKLPRFLQKCAQAFESDARYHDDSRYMDYVDDAKVVLRKMEKNDIGLKRAMFYAAYALYYEKQKKFAKAENMYRLGVKNLAEPADELQKSYKQFLCRMRLLEERKTTKLMLKSGRSNRIPCQQGKFTSTENQRSRKGEASQISLSTIKSEDQQKCAEYVNSIEGCSTERDSKGNTKSSAVTINTTTNLNEASNKNQVNTATDDTVVVKFVGSAIVGKSELAEDGCHHGLVDPTVNMKEVMNDISNMFKEPLEPEPVPRRNSHKSRPQQNQKANNVLQVFVDESSEERSANPNSPKKPFVGEFKIWTEEEDSDENDGEINDVRLNDDTVFQRFVGSAVFDDPKVENACHHGLVDPTVNLKEAMDDINGMFGKPLNFVRASRHKKEAKPMEDRPKSEGFVILADGDLEEEDIIGKASESESKFGGENDLFEPTLFTKEAMAEINDMFGKSFEF